MPSPGAFDELGLRAELVAAVTSLGYEEPTPVQRESIPLLLAGRDILSQAGTGTGKTAAFALPMLQRIAAERPARRAAGQACGVVLVPTRELAMQVAEAIHKYGKPLGCSVLPLYGGAPMHQQVRALQRGADVVVGTPGRVLDHLRRETLDSFDAPAGPGPRRGRRDARHGLRRRPRRDLRGAARGAPDGAVLGDDAAAHPADHQAAPEGSGAGHHREREGRQGRRAARPPGRLRRVAGAQAGGAGPHHRHGRSGGDAGVLPHAPRSRIAGRDVQRARPARRGAARRHGAAPARQGDGLVPVAEGRRADRHRRRGPRPRHHAHHPRRQLRRAGVGRGLPAPHRPHRPGRPHRHGHHAGRDARAPLAQGARAHQQVEDRDRADPDGRRPRAPSSST